LAAFVTIVGFNKGIYLGSTTTTSTYTNPDKTIGTATHKVCRYLFVTGIAELPARGGISEMPGYAIDENPPRRPMPQASALHCRLFES
jgi:hypothetical protein